MSYRYVVASLCLAASAALVTAQESPRLEPLRVMGSWEAGQIESFEKDASGPGVASDREMLSHSAVWLLQEARLSENARVYLGVGGMYFFILPSEGNQYANGQRSAFGLTDAHAEFDFGARDNGDYALRLKAGIFPFKYNPDAKNLGEYMFRTYTYPTIITTGGLVVVNSAGVQLNGASAATKIGGVTNEVLLTIKTDQIPTAALSLTDIVSYTFGDFLTVGAGYMFDNFYNANGVAEGNTQDRSSMPQEYYYELDDGTYVLYDPNAPRPANTVDSGHFTFVGQKAMFRASLDLGNLAGSLVPLPGVAPGTFKLYYEAILMGVENRPIFYEKRKDRIAHMVGANIPTFGLLDMLSLEVEYCSNPYAPDMSSATYKFSPTPNLGYGSDFSSDDLKWTAYARKTLIPGFAVTAQAARDHSRLVDYFGHTNDMEILPKRKNWYWAVQLAYSI
jgi:hypothetical protein